MSFEQKILEELIYERVRVNVNLCELLYFEKDLEQSIERALASCARSIEEKSQLARQFIDAAWKRLEKEWRDEAQDLDEPCPMCNTG